MIAWVKNAVRGVVGTKIAAASLAVIAVCALCAVTCLPARADAWTVTSTALTDNERQIAQALLDGGLDELHTAAIMGNIKQESGCNPSSIQISHNCQAPNAYANCNGKGGHGLFQLEHEGGNNASSRFRSLNNFAQSMGTTWRDISAQIGYMFSEADQIFRQYSTAYYIYADHGYSGDGIRGVGYLMTFSDWQKIDDLDWAVQSFEQIYEGASIPRMQNRINYARDYYKILMSEKPLEEETVKGSTSVSVVGGVKVLMRYAGNTRYDTANLINADVSVAGTYSGVIIASGQNGKYPDALCASGLSSVLGYPIMLIDGSANAVSTTIRDTIVSLCGSSKTNVIILGGTGTINEGLEYALAAFDSNGEVERIWGEDRYGTASAIFNYGASHGGWPTSYAVVVKGNDFPDALGAASFCATTGAAMLLSDANTSSLESYVTTAASRVSEVLIVGGTTSVSAAKEQSLASLARTVERVSGNTRYDTNTNLVTWECNHGMSMSTVGVATGTSFPDALGSAYLLSITDSVLVLTSRSDSENAGLYAFLREHANNISLMKIFGGTSTVSSGIETALVNAMLGK